MLPLIFSSCTIDWTDEKDKKIEELSTKRMEFIFNKNVECGKIGNEQWEKYSNKYALSDKGYSRKVHLEGSFYDKKDNKCLMAVASYETINGKIKVSHSLYDPVSEMEHENFDSYLELEERIKELR